MITDELLSKYTSLEDMAELPAPEEIDRLIKSHPYFSYLYYLKFQKALSTGKNMETSLKAYSLRAPDRDLLKELLRPTSSKIETVSPKPAKPSEEEEKPVLVDLEGSSDIENIDSEEIKVLMFPPESDEQAWSEEKMGIDYLMAEDISGKQKEEVEKLEAVEEVGKVEEVEKKTTRDIPMARESDFVSWLRSLRAADRKKNRTGEETGDWKNTEVKSRKSARQHPEQREGYNAASGKGDSMSDTYSKQSEEIVPEVGDSTPEAEEMKDEDRVEVAEPEAMEALTIDFGEMEEDDDEFEYDEEDINEYERVIEVEEEKDAEKDSKGRKKKARRRRRRRRRRRKLERPRKKS